MSDIMVGLIALVAGIVLCWGGRQAFRIILAVWGAFVGFTLGGSLISAATGEPPFATILGWVVGVLVGLLFASLAYGFYVLAVVIAIGSIGYGLGAGMAVALGATGSLPLVIGIVAAVLLAIATLVTNLPDILLTVLTALAGAAAIVAGLMILVGVAEPAVLGTASLRDLLAGRPWWWTVLYLVAATVGIVVQNRAARVGTRERGGMRSNWPARR